MKDSIMVNRKKTGLSNMTNPSLVSPDIPTLASPIRGFTPQINTSIIQTLPEVSSQAQSTSEQVLELEALKRSPLGHDISRISLRPQAKLNVSQPEDMYEQEADMMANPVMSMPLSTLQREPMLEDEEEVKTKTLNASIQRDILPEEIQTKASLQHTTDGSLQAGGNIESRLNSSKGGGSPLGDDVQGFMEPRFGDDFSKVRVHTGGDAVQMNRDLSAQAFAHGSDIYFGTGKSPGNNELMAHELTHVVQETGTSEISRLPQASPAVQREPSPSGDPPKFTNRWDRIANEIFGCDSYEEYKKSSHLISIPFFGQKLVNIHGELATRLQQAEKEIKAKYGDNYAAPKADSILRSKASLHGWGMAIDFNVMTDPYVMYESGEKTLDEELKPAYNHIAQFMLGKQESIILKLKGGRSALGGSVDSAYDLLREESDAMKRYFAMMNDEKLIKEFIAGEWTTKHPEGTTPDVAAIQSQMKEDYVVLGGKDEMGNKRPTNGKGDRPFAPKSAGGTGDPSTGFLNLNKEFVLALTNAGLAWGAIDIPGEPGDIQHFDLRFVDPGKRTDELNQKYKKQGL